MASEYTDEERNALAGMFAMFDPEGTGFVQAAELGSILQRIGRDPEQAEQIANSVGEVTGGRDDGKVSFEEFLELLARGSAGLAHSGDCSRNARARKALGAVRASPPRGWRAGASGASGCQTLAGSRSGARGHHGSRNTLQSHDCY